MEIYSNIKALFRKYPVPVSLNIVGLVMAFTAFIMIMVHVRFEWNFDRCYPKPDCVFKVDMPETPFFRSILPPGFAESIIHASAHVEAGSVFCPFVGEVYLTVTEADGKRTGYKQEANLVSPGFFDVFGLEVTEGEREALSKPNQLAIPESLAKKMFGEESPVGKPIRMESKSAYFLPLTDWQVGAVYKDLPGNTQLGNNILAPMPASFFETFGNSNFICYLRLDDPSHASSVADEFNRAFDFSRYPYLSPIHLTPLPEVYFSDAETEGHVFKLGSRMQTYLLILIAVLIVFVGMFNFTNFYISLMPSRLRGINTRKILGAEVWMLRLEQVLEVGCLVGLSSLLAVAFSLPVSEWFAASGIIQEPVTFASCRTLYIATVGGAWLVGMAAGLYPAYFVTSFPTALLLKGNYGLTPSGRKIKSGLLVLQYAIACSLLVFIAFVFLQNRMMMRSNTNFDQDQLAIVQLTSEMVEKQGTWLQETLRQYAEVEDVAFATECVGGQDSYSKWSMEWKGEKTNTYRLWCSPNFFDVMGIKIVEGRNFTGDTDSGYIINSFVRDHYGVGLGLISGLSNEIVGICEEVSFTSARKEKAPIVFSVASPASGYLPVVYIRLKKGFDAVTAVSHIRQAIAKMDAAYPVEVEFYDQVLNTLYQKEVRFGKTLLCFSLLAVVLSLIGVFALVIFDMYYKRKEIALRKVFGAELSDIVGLGLKPYCWFVGIGFVLALPFSWWVVSGWLENFAFRVPLTPVVFILIFILMQILTATLVFIMYATLAREVPRDSLSVE